MIFRDFPLSDLSRSIRLATAADLAALSALSIEVWLDTYAPSGITRPFADHVLSAYSVEALAQELESPDRIFLVCEHSGFLLAYAKLSLSPEIPPGATGTAELETLYVRHHHKRQGIGAALFHRSMETLSAHGHERVFLTVFAHNQSALKFYDALGLEREGRFIFHFEDQSAPNIIFGAETSRFSR
ncbi:N-acetyltransferase family protein [Roseibium sp.]|uniref:GNAT family N-acetyltransferase n=1 Tax=Roseibium sp. TaxID=1936156 RepID=UPI00391A4229